MTDTFFLDQHGCAKNQVDGELLIARLAQLGFTRTDVPEEAALIIVNSCGFIESAKKESIDSLLEARAAYPDAKIVLAGCLAERYADDFADSLPEADAVFGNGDIAGIDEVVAALFPARGAGAGSVEPVETTPLEGIAFGAGATKQAGTALGAAAHTPAPHSPLVFRAPQTGVSCGERIEFLGFKNSAFVKITEGCNNCCSFCAIPLIRGELRSRPAEDIVAEIRSLLERGIFEINLIGQDLAAYGRDGVPRGDSGNPTYFAEPSPLAELLRKISQLPGVFWVRLLYIHPDHFPFDIIPVLNADSRILPYFDIPFQSGSAQVLAAMNRSGTPETYRALVERLRAELKTPPVIRTTFLCGFPGETATDAAETARFLEAVESDWSGCFAYSREDDTPAWRMKGQVRPRDKEKRVGELEALQEAITERRLQAWVGKTLDALIEEVIDAPENDAGIALGRVWFQAPEVDGATVVRYELESAAERAAVTPGNVVRVKVLGVTGVDLDTLLVL